MEDITHWPGEEKDRERIITAPKKIVREREREKGEGENKEET